MPKKRDNLRRRPPVRIPKRRFLLVCEGAVTEPCYFNELRHLYRSLIDLDIVPGGTPKTVVERAVDIKKESERAAKREKDDNLRYDKIWCVFDVDEHPFLPEAQQQAKDNRIAVAISNPCFELWALLHFQDQHAHINRHDVQRLCRQHIPRYEKKLPVPALLPRYAEAVRRASELDNWHENRGTIRGNPSTGVHRLSEEIRAESRA